MRTRRLTVIGPLAAAVLLTPWRPVSAQENPISPDPQKGTLDGSPPDDELIFSAHLRELHHGSRVVPESSKEGRYEI